MFKFVTKSELQSQGCYASQWYIRNLLPVSGTTIVYGVPGEGKSTICMEWALSLQNGLPFAGHEPLEGDFPGERINTAWLTFEDGGDQEMASRLSQHDSDLDWPILVAESATDGWADPTSLLLDGSNGVNDNDGFSAESQRRWDELGKGLQAVGVRVLFIDTLSDLAGIDVGPRRVQNCFRLLASLRKQYGVATVLIGHSSSHVKEGRRSTELLGATAWVAKARHTVLVDGNSKSTWARVTKSNRGPTGFNVEMQKVDGGPIKVIGANSQAWYIAAKQKSEQRRDWDKKRTQAATAREAGSEYWTSAQSIGAACGGSKSTGKAIIHAGFFRSVSRGRYEPVDALIDADWETWQSSKSA